MISIHLTTSDATATFLTDFNFGLREYHSKNDLTYEKNIVHCQFSLEDFPCKCTTKMEHGKLQIDNGQCSQPI